MSNSPSKVPRLPRPRPIIGLPGATYILLLAATGLPAAARAEPVRAESAVPFAQPADKAELVTLWRDLAGGPLADLVARGLGANPELEIALARLDGARARLRAAGARLSPSMNLGLTGQEALAGPVSLPRQSSRGASAGLTLAYEVDLFGALRKARGSASERVAAAGFERDAVTLALACDISRLAIATSASEAQLRNIDEQLALTRELARMIQRRSAEREAGTVERGLVVQQLSALESERARLSGQRGAQLAGLALLLGEDATVPALPVPVLPAFETLTLLPLAPQQPFTRLGARPDVAAARAALRAADLDAEALDASRMPALRLSAGGILGLVGGAVSSLASLAADLSANLFEGGAIEARSGAARALAREARASYDLVRLTASSEAVSALAALEAASAREASWIAAAGSVGSAAETARLAYLDGDMPFNLVIETRRNAITAKSALVEARSARLLAQLDVVRAMGGRPLRADDTGQW